MLRPLLITTLLLTPGLAFGFSKTVENAFKGQILFSMAPLQAKATDKETIAWFKTAKLTKIPCGKDTAGANMTTFHVTAFPPSPVTGMLTLKLNTATRQVSADGKGAVDTGVQITADDAVGPTLAVTLLQGTTSLAAGTVDATCLVKSKATALPPKKK